MPFVIKQIPQGLYFRELFIRELYRTSNHRILQS